MDIAHTRLDVSPLFGTTDDSPVADVFVAFSWLSVAKELKQPKRPCPVGSVLTPMLPTAVPEKIQEKKEAGCLRAAVPRMVRGSTNGI